MADKNIYVTMRGNKIDVDLIKIKSSISTREKNAGVIKREQFINDKRKRISKKRMNEMLNNQLEVMNKLNEQELYKKVEAKEIDEKNKINAEAQTDIPIVEQVNTSLPEESKSVSGNDIETKKIRKKK